MILKGISRHDLLNMGWILLLLLIFGYFWRIRQGIVATKRWVKIEGRISRCELVTHHHQSWPKLEYTYQVVDDVYTGESIFLDTSFINPNSGYARRLAYQLVTAYNNDDDVNVYYNPEKPFEAILDTTIPPKLNVVLGLLAALVVLQLLLCLKGLFF